MILYATCKKESYTWEGDGEQHRFCNVLEGHVYAFDKRDNTYWIVPELSSTNDFKDRDGFISGVARGLEEKYFREMFEV